MEKLITQLVEELFHKNKKDLQNLVVIHTMNLYQITFLREWWSLQKKKTLKSLESNQRRNEEREEKGLGVG